MKIPYYNIMLDGINLVPYLGGNLMEFRYNDKSGAHVDSLEMEVADDGSLTLPRVGVEMNVIFGFENESPRIERRFAIDQIEHAGPPARIQMSATTADFTSQARAPRERSHSNLTFGELIETLATEHGYEFKVVPEELANVSLSHVDQAGQSDLALAWEIARSHNAIFKPVDGFWWVRSYDALGEAAHTIRPADVSAWRAHFLARTSYASVIAHYHDFDMAQRVPVVIGEGLPQLVLDATYSDENMARWHAKAAISRARRESRNLSLVIPGRPDLTSQQVIRLEGFRDYVDDTWLITEVVHTINKRGYNCRIECEGV